MATVPSQRTWTAGEVVTASMNNANVRDAVNFCITNRPRLIMTQTATQTLTTATWTAITFDVEVLDNDGMHSTVTNTSRATAVTPGYYEGSGLVAFANGTTGGRQTRWAVNGTVVNASLNSALPTFTTAVGVPAVTVNVYLNVGDYLELFGWQNSGAGLATSSAAEAMSRMNVRWLGT